MLKCIKVIFVSKSEVYSLENRYLFMFGGSPPFGPKLGEKFANLALQGKKKAAILFIERDGWQEYMPYYTSVLKEYGLEEFIYLSLSANPDGKFLEELTSCSGIIICGGDTELYHQYIVNSSIGKSIKEMYNRGIPVAGFSAGALISPANCVIPSIDNSKNEHLYLEGLDLIDHCVISVHFSEWNEEENLKFALEKVNVPIGYGIDEGAGIFFKNERLLETEGESIHIFHKD